MRPASAQNPPPFQGGRGTWIYSRDVAPGCHAPRRWRVNLTEFSIGENGYGLIYELGSNKNRYPFHVCEKCGTNIFDRADNRGIRDLVYAPHWAARKFFDRHGDGFYLFTLNPEGSPPELLSRRKPMKTPEGCNGAAGAARRSLLKMVVSAAAAVAIGQSWKLYRRNCIQVQQKVLDFRGGTEA